MDMIDVLKIVLLIQLFWGFSMTGIVYALPDDALVQSRLFTSVSSGIDVESKLEDVQSNLEQQRDMPIVELGALVFYSGNILIDLLLNSLSAIPQMFEVAIGGLMYLISIDSYVTGTLQIFTSTLWGIFYVLGIIEMLISLRGRGSLA